MWVYVDIGEWNTKVLGLTKIWPKAMKTPCYSTYPAHCFSSFLSFLKNIQYALVWKSHSKSIKMDTVFTKTEMKNEWNVTPLDVQYIVMRKYICWVMGEAGNSLTVSNYSSKQNNGKRGHFSLPLSLSLQGDMGMGEPPSLLAMYVSAEKETFDHDCYRGRARQKKSTPGEFSNYGS